MSHMDNEINPRTLSPRLLGAGRQHLVPRCALQGRRPQRMVINKMVFIGSL